MNRNYLKYIDHSILTPNWSDMEIEKSIRDVIPLKPASICIMPCHVTTCSELLNGTGIATGTVIGFPHGTNTTAIKLVEIEDAALNGAREVDAVINITKAISNSDAYVETEIRLLTRKAHSLGLKIKIILENCYQTKSRIAKLCTLCTACKVDWVKTSTGFGPTGVTLDDIRHMMQYVVFPTQIKASGGIKTLSQIKEFIEAGATRIGCSKTLEIF